MAQPQRPPTNAAAVQQRQRSSSIRALLESRAAEMGALIPRHLTSEKLLKVALFAISRDPKLLACSDRSLVECVLKSSALGLEPNTPLGHAYLIPYGTECTLVIGYRGYVQLAINSGRIQAVWARCAYAAEVERGQFRVVAGTGGERIEHLPILDEEERGPLVAVYAIAKHKGEFEQFEVMTRAAIDRIRSRSRAGNAGPWVSDYEEMAKKTVVRRLAKQLPLSPEDHAALEEADEPETVEARPLNVAGPQMRPVEFSLPATSPALPADVDPVTGEVGMSSAEAAEIVAAEHAEARGPIDQLLAEVAAAGDARALDELATRAGRLDRREARRAEVAAAIDGRRKAMEKPS